jgi:flavin-dependent dehydrogenase
MGEIGPVGIVGGGPAGAELARRLAEAGIECVLYEAEPDRTKPCGGGLTPRTMSMTPLSVREETRGLPVFRIHSRSPSGRAFDLRLSEPITVVSRKEFDHQLRRAAIEAGAQVVYRRVRTVERQDGFFLIDDRERFPLLAGAGGFNCPVARALAGPLASRDLAASIGYYLDGGHASDIVIQFVSGLAGYLWFFPGPSTASAGLAGPAHGFSVRRADTTLKNFIGKLAPGQALDRRYAWAAPSLRPATFDNRPVAGENWILVGDAAGLCDPITGEGIAHALDSAALAARAIQAGDLGSYRLDLEKGILRELRRAAAMKEEFFKPRFLRLGHLVMSGSTAANDLCRRFAEGKISYHDLKPDSYRILPRALCQVLGSKLGFRG